MHQNIIGCEFRHWIRTPRAKVPPVAGNMLSWPATAADHEIVSISAISARNGLKMRPCALHAYADGGSDREDGLRNMKCTSGGQQPSSSASATLLLHEHQHLKCGIITALVRLVRGHSSPVERPLSCQRHERSSPAMMCASEALQASAGFV